MSSLNQALCLLRRLTSSPFLTPADPSTAVAKSSKAKAAAFSIDFTSPEPAVPLETLFEPAGKTSITLPSAKKAAPTGKKRISLKKKEKEPQQDLWLLPDDLHFSSQQLLRLFTKKQFTVSLSLVVPLFKAPMTDRVLLFFFISFA